MERIVPNAPNGLQNSALKLIEQGKVDLVINVPVEFDELGRPDGYMIRRSAVDNSVPLITDLQLARAVVEALRSRARTAMRLVAWNDMLRPIPR